MSKIQIDDNIRNLFEKALKNNSKGGICRKIGYVPSSSVINKILNGTTKTIYPWQVEEVEKIIKR